MAQKAAKQQAARNTSILKRTHLSSLAINAAFFLLRLIIFQASCTRATYLLYGLLSAPAFVVEFWFERIGRPTVGPNGELKKAGEDLEAKGLTEYMWDILYWTWGCTAIATIFGDKAWWGWIVVPLYSIWLAWTTFGGLREGMAGMIGAAGGGEMGNGSASNRQKKFEKRGGQRMQYR
ncbi:MAG: hypothetical protein LQ343_002194 [Gyalolechia ehrenbergii]|nr:MAG: hypothetical protein LQ343_002194 [Gyalolechia ehrenbergii]